MKDQLQTIKPYLDKLGYQILSSAGKHNIGPDIWLLKNNKPYSMEIKKARMTAKKSIQVPPVEKNRLNDDFIAIIHPSGYVLIEEMKQHLKCCAPSGSRTLKF